MSKFRISPWNLERIGLEAHISKAVVVEGGLTPPPSRSFPGTKCYMVTVIVDGCDHFGFGPTPSIARCAAIQDACKSLCLAEKKLELTDSGVQELVNTAPEVDNSAWMKINLEELHIARSSNYTGCDSQFTKAQNGANLPLCSDQLPRYICPNDTLPTISSFTTSTIIILSLAGHTFFGRVWCLWLQLDSFHRDSWATILCVYCK